MKNPLIKLCTPLVLGVGLALTTALPAQTVTTTTRETTSDGTISSFEPHDFVIRSSSSAETTPSTYSYTTSTRYVDDTGAEIVRQNIQPGAPVTVYYTRDGDRVLASRVVVHRTVAPVPAATSETTTRTTTTTERPITKDEIKEQKKEAKEERKREREAREHPERELRREEDRGNVRVVTPAPSVSTETVTTEGTVSSFAPNEFVVRSESAGPVTYRYSKTTEYVDDQGTPVNVEVVRSGAPVTVHYSREGDGFIARRVIVHRSGPPGVVVRPLSPP